MMVLRAHLVFRVLAIQGAAGRLPMRTGAAYDVRNVRDFDQSLRVFCQLPMNLRHIVDETRAIALSPKSLQAEQCVSA